MNSNIITFITACTALMAAIVGPVITFRIGRAQINAAVLSTNRQKWIDGFRDLVSTFCSQVMAAVYVRERLVDGGRSHLGNDPDLLRRLEYLVLTATKIRLMINPAEADHQNLIAMMDTIMTQLRTAPSGVDLEGEMEQAIDGIVHTTQIILKREWVRVKQGR